VKLETALLAFLLRKDGEHLREIGRRLGCGITMAHHLSRVGEGYLRKLSRMKYVIDALNSLGEAHARSDI